MTQQNEQRRACYGAGREAAKIVEALLFRLFAFNSLLPLANQDALLIQDVL